MLLSQIAFKEICAKEQNDKKERWDVKRIKRQCLLVNLIKSSGATSDQQNQILNQGSKLLKGK